MPCKTPPARFRPETPETRRTARVDVISICPTAFSHGLLDFCTSGDGRCAQIAAIARRRGQPAQIVPLAPSRGMDGMRRHWPSTLNDLIDPAVTGASGETRPSWSLETLGHDPKLDH